LEDLKELVIGELADYRTCDDIGSALGAFAIQAMTTGAFLCERFLSARVFSLRFGAGPRRRSVLAEEQRWAGEQESELQRYGFEKV
jgi:hypothetical protein